MITAPSDLETVRQALEQEGVQIDNADITHLPAATVPVAEEEARKVLRLIDALDDLDDVQAVYANYDIDDSVMETVLAEA